MNKYVLYCGLKDKDTKSQEVSTIKARNIIADYCAECFGGATIYKGKGVYKHMSGTTIQENTLIIELMYINDIEKVKEFKQFLIDTFNQESVLCIKSNIEEV